MELPRSFWRARQIRSNEARIHVVESSFRTIERWTGYGVPKEGIPEGRSYTRGQQTIESDSERAELRE